MNQFSLFRNDRIGLGSRWLGVFVLALGLSPAVQGAPNGATPPGAPAKPAELPVAVGELYARTFPGKPLPVRYGVAGDWNGDGESDYAVFVGDPDYQAQGVETLRLALFLGKGGGDYELAAVSGELPGAPGVFHRLVSRARTLYLYRNGQTPASTDAGADSAHPWVESFQFQFEAGKPVLVGVEMAEYLSRERPDGSGQRLNFREGSASYWRQEGGRAKRFERSFTPGTYLPLADFRYADFMVDSARRLGAVVDEHFNLVSGPGFEGK